MLVTAFGEERQENGEEIDGRGKLTPGLRDFF